MTLRQLRRSCVIEQRDTNNNSEKGMLRELRRCNIWASDWALSFLPAKAKKAQSLPQLLVLVAETQIKHRPKAQISMFFLNSSPKSNKCLPSDQFGRPKHNNRTIAISQQPQHSMASWVWRG